MVMVAMAACSAVYDTPEDYEATGGSTLHLRISTVSGTTRSTASEAFEKISTLRIILLDAEGAVEANRYYNDLTGYNFNDRHTGKFDFVITQLTPGPKTLYMIANEEGMAGTDIEFIRSAARGAQGLGPRLEAVEFAGFRSDWYMPYCAKYELTLGKGSENYRALYLVPAATKFSFRFFNYRSEKVKVKTLTLDAIADRSYMLADVGPTDYWKTLPSETDARYWIDWLAYVAEASWATDGDHPENVKFNEKYGWISDYALPGTAAHSPVVVSGIPDINPIATDATQPSFTQLVYLPESFHSEDGLTQRYTLRFDIEGGESLQTVEFPLPNVKALFRDTHVKVDIRMKGLKIEVDADVDPWDEDELNPEFGGGNSGTTDNDPWDEDENNPEFGGGGSGTTDNDPWDEDEQNPNFGIFVWSGATDVDPWDEDELNPEFGAGGSGLTDNDPWNEDENNPEYGGGNSGTTDNDPWDEDESNPEYGGGNSGSTDNDPWDEDENNPEFGGGNSGTTDNDPWDEDENNPEYGGGGSGTTDNDPWDENEQNPTLGQGQGSGSADQDPWDEKDLNPSFGK